MAGFLSTLKNNGITPESLIEAVRRSRQPLVGGAGIKVTSGPAIGTCVSLLAPPAAPRGAGGVLVKVTGNETGGGKYKGYLLRNPTNTTIVASSNLTDAEIGSYTEADANLILILNATESGQTTHDLTSGTARATIFVAKQLIGVKSDHATPRSVYVISNYDMETCA